MGRYLKGEEKLIEMYYERPYKFGRMHTKTLEKLIERVRGCRARFDEESSEWWADMEKMIAIDEEIQEVLDEREKKKHGDG